jgi:hypothetical protein
VLPAATPEAVTLAVQERLEELLVHVEDEEQEKLLRALRAFAGERLAREAGAEDPRDRHRVEREMAAAVRRFSQEEPDRVDAFRSRLFAHADLVARHGLPADVVSGPIPLPQLASRFAIAVVLLPVAAWGLAFSWLPYRLSGWLGEKRARKTDRTTVAWYSLTSGMLVFPAFWIVAALLVGAIFGLVPAMAALLLAAPTGLVARWCCQALEAPFHLLVDRLTLGAAGIRSAAEREAEWLWQEVSRWRQLHRLRMQESP